MRMTNVYRPCFNPLPADHSASTFDGCVSGHVQPTTVVHSPEVLTEVARILSPGGLFCIQEPSVATQNGSQLRTPDNLCSVLKLAGFVHMTKVGLNFFFFFFR